MAEFQPGFQGGSEEEPEDNRTSLDLDLEVVASEGQDGLDKEGHPIVTYSAVAKIVRKSDNTGVPGKKIFFMVGQVPLQAVTEEDGMTEPFPLEVRERMQEFNFHLLGTGTDKSLYLRGPKPPKPVFTEELKNSFKTMNPIGAFFAGWKARGQAERRGVR